MDSAIAECSICQGEFKEQLVGKIVVCKHLFCFSCIQTWATNSTNCPNCRKNFRQVEQLERPIEPNQNPGDLPAVSTDYINENYKIKQRTNFRKKQLHVDYNYEEDLEAYQSDDLCGVCGSNHEPESIKVCASCLRGYHTFCSPSMACAEPPLICEDCLNEGISGGDVQDPSFEEGSVSRRNGDPQLFDRLVQALADHAGDSVEAMLGDSLEAIGRSNGTAERQAAQRSQRYFRRAADRNDTEQTLPNMANRSAPPPISHSSTPTAAQAGAQRDSLSIGAPCQQIQCAVCQYFGSQNLMIALPCGHSIHSDCVSTTGPARISSTTSMQPSTVQCPVCSPTSQSPATTLPSRSASLISQIRTRYGIPTDPLVKADDPAHPHTPPTSNNTGAAHTATAASTLTATAAANGAPHASQQSIHPQIKHEENCWTHRPTGQHGNAQPSCTQQTRHTTPAHVAGSSSQGTTHLQGAGVCGSRLESSSQTSLHRRRPQATAGVRPPLAPSHDGRQGSSGQQRTGNSGVAIGVSSGSASAAALDEDVALIHIYNQHLSSKATQHALGRAQHPRNVAVVGPTVRPAGQSAASTSGQRVGHSGTNASRREFETRRPGRVSNTSGRGLGRYVGRGRLGVRGRGRNRLQVRSTVDGGRAQGLESGGVHEVDSEKAKADADRIQKEAIMKEAIELVEALSQQTQHVQPFVFLDDCEKAVEAKLAQKRKDEAKAAQRAGASVVIGARTRQLGGESSSDAGARDKTGNSQKSSKPSFWLPSDKKGGASRRDGGGAKLSSQQWDEVGSKGVGGKCYRGAGGLQSTSQHHVDKRMCTDKQKGIARLDSRQYNPGAMRGRAPHVDDCSSSYVSELQASTLASGCDSNGARKCWEQRGDAGPPSSVSCVVGRHRGCSVRSCKNIEAGPGFSSTGGAECSHAMSERLSGSKSRSQDSEEYGWGSGGYSGSRKGKMKLSEYMGLNQPQSLGRGEHNSCHPVAEYRHVGDKVSSGQGLQIKPMDTRDDLRATIGQPNRSPSKALEPNAPLVFNESGASPGAQYNTPPYNPPQYNTPPYNPLQQDSPVHQALSTPPYHPQASDGPLKTGRLPNESAWQGTGSARGEKDAQLDAGSTGGKKSNRHSVQRNQHGVLRSKHPATHHRSKSSHVERRAGQDRSDLRKRKRSAGIADKLDTSGPSKSLKIRVPHGGRVPYSQSGTGETPPSCGQPVERSYFKREQTPPSC